MSHVRRNRKGERKKDVGISERRPTRSSHHGLRFAPHKRELTHKQPTTGLKHVSLSFWGERALPCLPSPALLLTSRFNYASVPIRSARGICFVVGSLMERVEKEGWMTYCRSDRGQRWFGSRGASPRAIFLEDILLSGLGSGWSACMESRYRLFGVVRWAGVRLDPRSVFGDRLTVQFRKDIYIYMYVFIRSNFFSLYLIYLDYSSLVFVNLFFLLLRFKFHIFLRIFVNTQ